MKNRIELTIEHKDHGRVELTKEHIKQGLNEAYNKAGHNTYYGNGFTAGVEFALAQLKKCDIGGVMLSAYYMIVDNEPTVVMAENISDVCDKLDELGVIEYEFVHAKSITIVH